MTITFFGHRDAPPNVKDLLKKTIIGLIEGHNANTFLVGNNGNFDIYAIQTLISIKQIYPNIKCTVVFAYFPKKPLEYKIDGIFPEELEFVPKRYAIHKRNLWMLRQADAVITYSTTSFGGSAYFKRAAKKQGKLVIDIANQQQQQ